MDWPFPPSPGRLAGMPAKPSSDYLLRRGRQRGLLLLCDHAGHAMPPELGRLGLDPRQVQRHIAWDPGALGVASELARIFDCDLLACLDSRLLADPNRAPQHPDLILAESDGIVVPGNAGLDQHARAARIARFHAPYHAAIGAELDAREAEGVEPFLLAVHSFEPSFAGQRRPWPVGVLWKDDPRLARALCDRLEQQVRPVGFNQPYDGHVVLGYTLEHHAIGRGLAQLLIEVRNDELDDHGGQLGWARRLADALGPLLEPWLIPLRGAPAVL